MNAAKPGEPGSAKKVGEHRFGLIVRSMGDGDAGAGSCIGERAEVVVAGGGGPAPAAGPVFLWFFWVVPGRGEEIPIFFLGARERRTSTALAATSPPHLLTQTGLWGVG